MRQNTETKKEQIELFFIGESFYNKSGTMMSSIYKVDKERYDWGFVQIALENGNTVLIRPATKEEMAWAREELRRQRGGEKQ